MECLVLGNTSAGKSLFIRRIREILEDRFDEEVSSEYVQPTIGVDITSITLHGIPLDLREIGGAISSRWNIYLSASANLIYVIDASDNGQLPSALVMLHEILANRAIMRNKPMLIALAKVDMTSSMSIVMARNFLRLQSVLDEWPNVNVIEGSSIDGTLCRKAILWLQTVLKV